MMRYMVPPDERAFIQPRIPAVAASAAEGS